VLVGTFSTEPEAHAVERRLSARAGYVAVIARPAEPPNAAGFSVLVGRYPDMNQAQVMRDALAGQEGFADARVVRTVESTRSQQ